jgi:hypothetical protein
VNTSGKELRLSQTGINGISTSVVKVPSTKPGSTVKASAVAPAGLQGILDMQMHYAEPEGWSVLSGS